MAKKMFDMWYRERNLYNYASGGFSASTGHFTALVWKSTRNLGCGVACMGRRCYGVCNYKKSGNVIGRFRQNVFPR